MAFGYEQVGQIAAAKRMRPVNVAVTSTYRLHRVVSRHSRLVFVIIWVSREIALVELNRHVSLGPMLRYPSPNETLGRGEMWPGCSTERWHW